MKYLKHKIYGILFNFFKIFSLKNNRITFIIDSNNSFRGNFDYIKKELRKRGNFEFNLFYKDNLSFEGFKKLATSKYIFLNDNFFPLAFMNFKKDSKVIQLWHAPGASKKFGGSVSNKKDLKVLSKIAKNTDFLFTTSKHVEKFYQEAFQIDSSKIIPLGIPRMDYYFENHDIDKLKESFLKKYGVENKKIVLYAPTFRNEEEYNNVFNYLNLDDFNKYLGDEYILALRFHPKIKNFSKENISYNGNYIDCSNYESEQALMLISDILITDYSSIMIEFAMLNKPIIFFVYDYDNYMANERGFYFDFKENVPGIIAYDSNQLIEVIKNKNFDEEKSASFVATQFDRIDGKSSERIVDFILNNGVWNG